MSIAGTAEIIIFSWIKIFHITATWEKNYLIKMFDQRFSPCIFPKSKFLELFALQQTRWVIVLSMHKHFITFSFSKFSIRLTRSIITLGSVGLLYIPRAKKTTSDWRHCKSSVNPIDNNSRNFGISSLISTGTGLSPPDESVWWVRNGGRSNVLLSRIATPIAKNKC